jgi:hypothetical protein
MNILYPDKVKEIRTNHIKLVSTYKKISSIVSNIKSDEDLNLLLQTINEYKEILDTFKEVKAAGFVPGLFLWSFSKDLYDLLKMTINKKVDVLPEEIEDLEDIIVKIKVIERKKNELNDYIVTNSANIKTDTLKNKIESIYTEMSRLGEMIDDYMDSGIELNKKFLRKLESLNEAQKTIYNSEKLFQDTVHETGLHNAISILLTTSFILPKTRNIIYGYIPDEDGNISNENKFFIPIIYRPGGFPELKLSVYKQIVDIKYSINIGLLRKILKDDKQYRLFLSVLKQYPHCKFDSMVFNTEDQKCMKSLIEGFEDIINKSDYSNEKKNDILIFLNKGLIEAKKLVKERGTSLIYLEKRTKKRQMTPVPKAIMDKPKTKSDEESDKDGSTSTTSKKRVTKKRRSSRIRNSLSKNNASPLRRSRRLVKGGASLKTKKHHKNKAKKGKKQRKKTHKKK